jgi:hypothetical protein
MRAGACAAVGTVADGAICVVAAGALLVEAMSPPTSIGRGWRAWVPFRLYRSAAGGWVLWRRHQGGHWSGWWFRLSNLP